VRRLAATTGRHLDDAVTVAATRVDATGLRDLVSRMRASEDLDELGLPLDGGDVMRLLDIAPGVEVGRALAFLRELRIAEGPLSPEAAAARLVAWWRDEASG
jgi:poly(A) polymerase